ncbi:MAG: hypothetical protein R3F37_07105 [Candidatus Competibacteraceae bacterium]
MKNLQVTISTLGMTTVVFLLGLGIAVSANASSGADQSSTSAETVKQETVEALAALKDYTIGRRDEMIEEAKQLLASLDQRIDQLSEKIEAQSASVDDSIKTQWRETLAVLRKQRVQVAEWLGGLQYSSQEAWEEVKEGFSQAYQELSDSLQAEETKIDDNQASSS